MAEKKGNNKDSINKEEQETIVDLNLEDVQIEDKIEESPLELARKEAEEYKNLLQRIQADFENYKKRNKELSSKMYCQGVTDAIVTVFPVIDSLELARNTYSDDKQKEGIDLVIKQFMKAFESLGVKEIDALNKDFNPDYHEAVLKGSSESGESGKVLEVYRKGYIYNERVIRHSMVKVSE